MAYDAEESRDQPQLSVVIPFYNEAENLREVYARTISALEALGVPFELVFVDDGSRDGGYTILQALQENDRRIRIVRLLRNFGQTPAIYAGFAHVRGAVVVTLDADLQNPPEDIKLLLDKLDEGVEVVQGWREDRQDSLFRKSASRLLNALVSKLAGGKVHDLGCGLKCFRREVVDQLVRFQHRARYLPAEIMWLGVNLAEVRVQHRPRAHGGSKYSYWKLLRLNFDMISSISPAPIKLVGGLGWLLSGSGFAMGALIIAKRLIYGNYNPLASVMAIVFILLGVQLIASGIMCEYIGRIFTEVQNKPYYIVKDVLE